MPPRKTPHEPEFSDSDRARLDELLEDRQFKLRLAEHEADRKRARNESIRIWAQVLASVILAASTLRDGIPWLLAHLKSWLGGP